MPLLRRTVALVLAVAQLVPAPALAAALRPRPTSLARTSNAAQLWRATQAARPQPRIGRGLGADARVVHTRAPQNVKDEPAFQGLRSTIDERGNDPTYTPQNGGTWSAARYQTTRFFDYQQTATVAQLAAEVGTDNATMTAQLAAAGVQLGLGDLNEDPSDDARRTGHVVKVAQPTVTLPSGALQPIVTLSTANVYGQTVRSVDAEKNVHLFRFHPSFDPDGDGQSVTGTTLTDTTGGHLLETVVDAASDPRREGGTNPTPVAASNKAFYDPIGNPIRRLDARGIEHRAEFNAVGELVRTLAATNTSGAYLPQDRALPALSYETLFFHDANGNVVETRVGNQGERTGDGAFTTSNPWWSTKHRYDILDQRVVTIQEIEPIGNDSAIGESTPGVAVTRFGYDPNQNPDSVQKPEGNATAVVFDERNKVFLVTRAHGTGLASVTKTHYDLNANPIALVGAAKKNPAKHPEFPEGDVSTMEWSGFDEQLCTEDPEGNCGDSVYDPTGRKVRFYRHGPEEEGEPRLSEVALFHDEAGRPFRTDVMVFAPTAASMTRGFGRTIPTLASGPYPGEELATLVRDMDAIGRVTKTTSPKGDETFAVYDGASRLIKTTGAAFSDRAHTRSVRNEAVQTYDGMGHTLRIVETDRSPLVTRPDETYVTDLVFDAVGRPIRVTDPIGQTVRTFFDSRSNAIVLTDAKSSQLIADPLGLMNTRPGGGPGTLINGHGNVARVFYDGLSRVVREERLLKIGGQGGGDANLTVDTNVDHSNPAIPSGVVTTRTEYDRNSRVTGRVDPNGNRTGCHFDELDRCDLERFADGTVSEHVYDLDDALVQTTDPNGTITRRTYDGAGRVVRVDVTRRAQNLQGTGQDVLGSTLQAFEYDGLSRVRQAIDDNGDAAQLGVATSATYDSLNRKLTERTQVRASVAALNVATTNNRIVVAPTGATIDRTVTSGYAPDVAGRIFAERTSLTYSSGRTLTFGIDGLDRTQTVTDNAAPAAPVVGYEFHGDRVVEETHANGTRAAQVFDAARRLVDLRHFSTDPLAPFAGFAHGWDRAGNRTFETSLHKVGAPRDEYYYDSLSRVVSVGFGVQGGLAARTASYQLDGANNFARKTEDGVTTTTNHAAGGSYTFDLLNRVLRAETFDAATGAQTGAETPVHDAGGARIRDNKRRLFFDAFERLVRVDRSFDNGTTFTAAGAYLYDARGRRVAKDATIRDAVGTFVADEHVAYVLDGDQELEEVSTAGGTFGQVVADTVFGSTYVDEPVEQRNTRGVFFLHARSLYSVAAVTDVLGKVVERYEEQSIYGRQQTTDAQGNALALAGEVGNPWRFQGRRWDAESGLVFFRARYLDPAEGRFVNRDPAGIWHDAANRGNAYAFAGGNPVNVTDPTGLGDFTSCLGNMALGFGKQALAPITAAIETAREVADVLLHPVDSYNKVVDTIRCSSWGDLGKMAWGAFKSYVRAQVNGAIGVGRAALAVATWGGSEIAIGAYSAYNAIQQGASLQQVCGAFGGSLFNAATAAWTRNQMSGGGQRTPSSDGRRPPCGNCFVAGTEIVLADGSRRAIEDVQVGDRVLAMDEAGPGARVAATVTRLYRNVTADVCHLRVVGTTDEQKAQSVNGETQESHEVLQTIRCTPGHPWYVAGKGWTLAADLRPGDSLVGAGGEPLVVASAELRPELSATYNFEVGGEHTYFVSQSRSTPAVWVHNASADEIANGGWYTRKAQRSNVIHAADADYPKHNMAKTPEEARLMSIGRRAPSQYLPGLANRQLEREALFAGIRGQANARLVPRPGGALHVYYDTGKVVGYSQGQEARWIRAELSSGEIHGHPLSEADLPCFPRRR